MDFRENLADFKKKVDFEIGRMFDQSMEEISEADPFSGKIISYAKSLTLSGGKRIRPALTYWGYKAFGGKEDEKIFKACVGIELIHMFLLIHDDIIDRAEKRHNCEVFNIRFEKESQELFKNVDHRRFGDSVAITAGDMLFALGNKAVLESGFDPKLVSKAVLNIQKVVFNTSIGQAQDLCIEYAPKAKEKDILMMYENKTAKYTFEGPLHTGAILAGADDGFLESLSEYALPMGIAFQIQDDILGIFGSEDKMGKSVGSDIVEGKKTILTAKAFESADMLQRERLGDILGKKDITGEQVKEFQNILIDSGALRYAKAKSEDLIRMGKENLEKMEIEKDSREFLISLADYLAKREH